MDICAPIPPGVNKICSENKHRIFSSSFNENKSPINSFLLNTCKYDFSCLTDIVLRNKLNEFIKNHKLNKIQTNNLTMSIILTDGIEEFQRSCWLLFLEKQEVEKHANLWLKVRIIRESCSDICSLITMCRKKNREYSLCVD